MARKPLLASLPTAFRVLPEGETVPLQRPQWRTIAKCLHEHRAKGILSWDVILETGIEQWGGRLAELRALGFIVDTIPIPNAAKGDRRKLYRLSNKIELTWGEA